MRSDFADRGHVDNCILVFESLDELVEGIRVGDTVDFDMGWKRSLGGSTREDFDVACKPRIGVEGGEDRGTEVARGL